MRGDQSEKNRRFCMNRGMWFVLFMALSFPMYGQSFGIVITVPESNWFYLKADDREFNRFGFLGLALEYRQKYFEEKYISVKVGVIMDFFLPVAVAYDRFILPDYSGEDYGTIGWFVIIEDQIEKNGIINLGYGLQYNSIFYRKTVWENGEIVEEKGYRTETGNFGLCGTGRSDFNNGFTIGMQYLLNVFSIADIPNIRYSHLLFFDIGGEISF
jgi:hypothetical protein